MKPSGIRARPRHRCFCRTFAGSSGCVLDSRATRSFYTGRTVCKSSREISKVFSSESIEVVVVLLLVDWLVFVLFFVVVVVVWCVFQLS